MQCLQALSWTIKMKESPILISSSFTFPVVVTVTIRWLKELLVLIKLYPAWHCAEQMRRNCAVPWAWCQLPCFSFVWFETLKSQLLLPPTMYSFSCQPSLSFHKRTAGEVLALRQLLGLKAPFTKKMPLLPSAWHALKCSNTATGSKGRKRKWLDSWSEVRGYIKLAIQLPSHW